MSFNALLIHDVLVTTPDPGVVSGTDVFGNPSHPETSVLERMRVQPGAGTGRGTSAENIADRDTRITRFTVFARPDTTANGLSVLTWDGRTLKVDGEPRPFYDRGALHHWELDAEEVLGG